MQWIDELLGTRRSADAPCLRRDLRSGAAGGPVRFGLTLASATGMLVPVMAFLAVVEVLGNVRPEHVASAVAAAGVCWCGILTALWWTFRRWRAFVQTVIIVAGIWLVTIPAAVLASRANLGDGFLIAACVFSGITASIVTVVVSGYYAYAGRPMTRNGGSVDVRCPRCGYSMVGLASCSCPECGHATTIDGLIRDQDYAALRGPADASPEAVRDADGASARRTPPLAPAPLP